MKKITVLMMVGFLSAASACGDDDTSGDPCDGCSADADGHACCAAEHGDIFYCGSAGSCVAASGCTANECCVPGTPGDEYCAATFGDCSSCVLETCTPQTCTSEDCTDNTLNGTETDVDCGGGDCPPCADGLDCEVATDCQSGYCDGTSCADCTDNVDCASLSGTWCDGGDCVPQLADGEACTEDAECLNGHCPAQDLVCCDAACDGECEACLATKTGGTDGTCEPVTADTDPDTECDTDELCDGAGACLCSLADANEPNDTEGAAVDLGTLSDADPDPLPTVSGVLASGDEDWFSFVGSDDIGLAVVDPTVRLTTALGPRVCAYFDCTVGTADFTCNSGALADTSTGGLPGCCTNTGVEVSVSLNCVGTGSDDATVYIKVDSLAAECLPYTLEYHY